MQARRSLGLDCSHSPPRIVVCGFPDNPPLFIGHRQRRAPVIGVYCEQPLTINRHHRTAIEIEILAFDRTSRIDLGHQALALIEKISRCSVAVASKDCLTRSLAESVVRVTSDHMTAGKFLYGNQAVERVISILKACVRGQAAARIARRGRGTWCGRDKPIRIKPLRSSFGCDDGSRRSRGSAQLPLALALQTRRNSVPSGQAVGRIGVAFLNRPNSRPGLVLVG